MVVPYQPLDVKGHRLLVGTRPLDMANWIETDDRRIAELETKAELQAKIETIHQVTDTARPAINELYELVLQNLADHHSEIFEIDFERQTIQDKIRKHTSAPNEPLLALGEQLQEDFCIMQKVQAEWLLTAAVLYSPSRWYLLDKIGKNLEGIHQPVPEYQSKLGKAVEQLFDRIEVDKPLWRTNWTILDNPTNFQPSPPSLAERKQLDEIDLEQELYFRVERQTLVRLPHTGAVVFTIRTYINNLAELLDAAAENRDLLLRNIESTSADHVGYRGWQQIAPKLIEFLRAK